MWRAPDYNPLRAAFRAIALIALLLVLFWPALVFWLLKLDRLRARAVQLVYIFGLKFSGTTVTRRGELSTERPLMLVANHSTYLDVFVLGKLTPVSFTPKKEIKSWPVIGFLCVLADCVFVERKPSEITEAKTQMERRLDKDKVLCLFPEGTTSDGKTTLPFRSGFLSLAEEYQMEVQPATIVYTHIGDEPMSDARRDEVAWIGETTFFGHFFHLLGLPSLKAEVVLHPPLHFTDFEDRKELTKAAEETIRQSLAEIWGAHAG